MVSTASLPQSGAAGLWGESQVSPALRCLGQALTPLGPGIVLLALSGGQGPRHRDGHRPGTSRCHICWPALLPPPRLGLDVTSSWKPFGPLMPPQTWAISPRSPMRPPCPPCIAALAYRALALGPLPSHLCCPLGRSTVRGAGTEAGPGEPDLQHPDREGQRLSFLRVAVPATGCLLERT